MIDEAAGVAIFPTQPNKFIDDQVEIKECQQIIINVHKLMCEVVNNPNWSEAFAIRSRLVHLLHRVDRLRNARPGSSLIQQLSTDVQKLFNDEVQMRDFLTRTLQEQAEHHDPSLNLPSSQPPNTQVTASTGARQKTISTNGQVQAEAHHPQQQRYSQAPSAPPSRRSMSQVDIDDFGMFPQNPLNIQTTQRSLFPNPPPQRPLDPISSTRQLYEPSSSIPLFNPNIIFPENRNTNPYLNASQYSNANQQPAQQSSSREARSSVMCKWTAKFSGDPNDISADEFLFRVEDMASTDNLHFNDMCRSIHVLLSMRAEEWYWSYRRKQRNISWDHFRTAFLKKFATTDTDEEIKSIMSKRAQQAGERFDDYCRSMEFMSLRLRNALPESNMISLLMHNISTVDMLQEICIKYENLWIKQGIWRRSRNIHEIQTVKAIQGNRQTELICWNCDEAGHSYQDCEVATRNIFCYSCGAKNVYRPQCLRCALNSNRRGINGPSNSGNPFAKQNQ